VQQRKEAGRPWLPALAGFIGAVIGFAAVFAITDNTIGAAGVGLIVFGVTWRSVRKYFAPGKS